MKRSQFIDLNFMRKVSPKFVVRPLALGISAAILSACGNNKEEVVFVNNIEDCVSNTSFDVEQCQAAYQQALDEAERTGPKYKTMQTCESEFGPGQCMQPSSGSFFMPLMAGFLINELLFDRDRRYYSGYYNPVYRYNRPYSKYHDLIMMSDGTVIGKHGKKKFKVGKSATSRKPAITKTVSRGGFGSVASAKSNWGGGKSRSSSRGWGG